jgi:hypothetical protein
MKNYLLRGKNHRLILLKPERCPPMLRSYGEAKAESTGFEPVRARLKLKGLANPRIGPLCQLSFLTVDELYQEVNCHAINHNFE